jgi:hypothetical protein
VNGVLLKHAHRDRIPCQARPSAQHSTRCPQTTEKRRTTLPTTCTHVPMKGDEGTHKQNAAKVSDCRSGHAAALSPLVSIQNERQQDAARKNDGTPQRQHRSSHAQSAVPAPTPETPLHQSMTAMTAHRTNHALYSLTAAQKTPKLSEAGLQIIAATELLSKQTTDFHMAPSTTVVPQRYHASTDQHTATPLVPSLNQDPPATTLLKIPQEKTKIELQK